MYGASIVGTQRQGAAIKLTVLLATSTLAAGAAWAGPAGQAAATDDITLNAVGTYDVYFGKQTTSNIFWSVTPCDDDADKCVQVTEFGSDDLSRASPRWTRAAFWSVGSWIMQPVDAKRSCEDNTRYGVTYNYAWDAATNAGYRSYFEPGICDDNTPHDVAAKFHLVRLAPTSTPVAQ